MANNKFINIFKNKNVREHTAAKDAVVEAKNWYAERYQSVLVQRNLLFLISAICIIGVVISVFAVQAISLSKNIEPFVIEVQPKTGLVTLVDPATISELPAKDAVTKYFITQYVRSREGYAASTYEYNYKTITRLLSTPAIYSDFMRTVSVDNKDSPITLYQISTQVDVQFRSLIFLSATQAQVRFTKVANGQKPGQVNKVAIVGFDYVDVQLSPDDREVNPLGFQVNFYKVDDENLS